VQNLDKNPNYIICLIPQILLALVKSCLWWPTKGNAKKSE